MTRCTQEQLDTPVAMLENIGLSLRVINMLEERAGVIWLRDLIGMDESELLSVHEIGPVIVQELRESLQLFLA